MARSQSRSHSNGSEPLGRMKNLAAMASALLFALAVAVGAPASADPISGTSTTVDMPMSGAEMPSAGGASGSGGSSYQSPSVSMAVQDGAGVDRDGTNGVIDPDGTNGRVSGPLLRATPEIRAEPAPTSPRVGG